ncbi:uncharacterized protein [Clytia hemisphaerica]|uniref:uncharacterized protein n=1 Tax=Clytia hemisphaerica TaxID=252671 RepID=UPI0034D6F7AE|eukprot:TCONS_00052872-protein
MNESTSDNEVEEEDQEEDDLSWELESDELVELIMSDDSHFEDIRKFIKENAPFNVNYCHNGWTPLHYATVKNKIDVCKLLVELGSDVNFMAVAVPWTFIDYTDIGRSPFQLSCGRAVSFDTFKFLLNNGGEVNKSWCGITPLMFIGREPELEDGLHDIETQEQKLLLLLEQGADASAHDMYGKNVLHHFDLYSEDENEEELVLGMIQSIINQNLDIINRRDSWGFTPLRTSTEVLRLSRIELLLKNGADIHQSRTPRDGSTIIHALKQINEDDVTSNFDTRFESCLQILLNTGISINTVTFMGNSILHDITCGTHSKDTVRKLLKHGANINQQNVFGHTPLHACLTYKDLPKNEDYLKNRLEIVELLFNSAADANIRTVNGMTPLMTAVRGNVSEHVSLLLKLLTGEYDLLATDKFGRTALHHCIIKANEIKGLVGAMKGWGIADNKEIFEMLIKSRIKPNLEDCFGKKAIYYTKFLSEHQKEFFKQHLEEENDKVETDEWLNYQTSKNVLGNYFDLTKSSNPHSKENEKVLKELFETKGIGSVHALEETSTINKEIEELMGEICHLINKKCKYGYQYSLLLSGGVGEGTKIGFPDEFDYLLMIEGFQDHLTPEDVKPGYVKLKLSEKKTNPFCSEGCFDSVKFTSYFYELVNSALQSPFIENTRFYLFPNEGDFNNERIKKTANFLITMEYYSKNFGTIELTIDLVPVLKLKHGWWPSYCSNPTKFQEHLCATLTKPAGTLQGQNLHLRISTSLVELSVIERLPNTVKSAYTILKVLKDICKCSVNEIVYRVSLYINTYLIKNALMKYAIENEYNELEAEEDVVDHVINILKNISVNSFFFPGMDIERPIEFDEETYDHMHDVDYRNTMIETLINFLRS